MSILGEIQKFNGDALIELFVLQLPGVGGAIYRFHAGTNDIKQPIVWQGQTYLPLPIECTGFSFSGTEQSRPKMKIANVNGSVSDLVASAGGLVNSKVVRKRTLGMYLDAVNFAGGNPSANPQEHFNDDIYYIVQLTVEDKAVVEFQLGASTDLRNVVRPGRPMLAGTCIWKYKGAKCGYTGGPVATIKDEPTTIAELDMCSGTIKGCEFRFGVNGILNTSAFVGSALVDI